jgi:hypothetical protein
VFKWLWNLVHTLSRGLNPLIFSDGQGDHLRFLLLMNQMYRQVRATGKLKVTEFHFRLMNDEKAGMSCENVAMRCTER